MLFKDYKEALNEAISAIVNLKETAQNLRDEIDNFIEALETLEDSI